MVRATSLRRLIVCAALASALASILGGAAFATTRPQSDACRAIIPKDLQQLLARKFPHHRLPLEADSGAYERQSLPALKTPCLLAVRGRFDGNSAGFVAVLISDHSPDWSLLVAARKVRNTWTVDTIDRINNPPGFFLERLPPGKYENPELEGAGATDLQPNELATIESRYEGVGITDGENSEQAFFFIHHKWCYVQTAD